MIIRITHEKTNTYVECSLSDDSVYEEVVEKIDGLMIAHGFHPDVVEEYRPEEVK